jgi:hypothetical protein
MLLLLLHLVRDGSGVCGIKHSAPLSRRLHVALVRLRLVPSPAAGVFGVRLACNSNRCRHSRLLQALLCCRLLLLHLLLQQLLLLPCCLQLLQEVCRDLIGAAEAVWHHSGHPQCPTTCCHIATNGSTACCGE